VLVRGQMRGRRGGDGGRDAGNFLEKVPRTLQKLYRTAEVSSGEYSYGRRKFLRRGKREITARPAAPSTRESSRCIAADMMLGEEKYFGESQGDWGCRGKGTSAFEMVSSPFP